MRKILLIFAAALVAAVAADEKKIVCYWGGWSVYRPGDGAFTPANMDPKLCTHLIYTFVGLSPDGKVKILDAWNDLPDGGGKNNIANFNALREQNPKLKTMMAIGGWNEGSTKYSKVVADPQLRHTFVESIVEFVKKYNFNGFDIDWEYPAQRGGAPADKQNYVLLLKELRERFDQEGFILSAAVGAAESSASQSYIIPEVSKYLHFINLMAYDLHGDWDKQTGFHSAIYPAKSESGGNAKLNVDAIIKYWTSQGAPAEKLILGIPTYGRSFTLSNEQSNGVGAPAPAKGAAGPFTREGGMLGYNEICDNIKNKNWQVKHDEERKSVYAYKGNQWVSYDDEKIVEEKTKFIKEHNLGGAMVWSIETDDFRGKCGEKFPLLNVLYRNLGSGVSSSPNTPSKPSGEAVKQPKKPQSNGSGDLPDYFSEENNSDDDLNSLPLPQKPQTTQKPQQTQPTQRVPPKPSHNGQVCQDEGYVRDPQKCANFYYCQFYQENYVEHLFNCPGTLLYDTTLGVCNWPEQVQC